MARPKGKPPAESPPPEGWAPTQAVDDAVINKPYDEPTRYWRYSPEGKPFIVEDRRPASYWFKTKKTGSAQQSLLAEEESDDLPLVNRLRKDVKRWRESGYRGVSPVTRDLFAYWRRTDRPRRLFFCQLEGVETIIYLLEIAFPKRLSATGFKNFELTAEDLEKLLKGDRPSFYTPEDDSFPRLVDIPGDGGQLPLTRLGCKMATGSGKTVVMAMLATWAFCNRGRNPSTTAFPSGILICAPNLTVKNRLQVLRPEEAENYYDTFDIVPAKYRELMAAGKVLITNWHFFAPKSEHEEGGTSYKVVDKGEETPEAFTKDRLGELAARLPILVFNDEGHHCWRPAPQEKDLKAAAADLTAEERKALEEDREEARVWLAGLDRINNAGLRGAGERCITACVDLSATPFYLSNSGYPEGSPFPWLVSDFGLVDAIESGIVKIPRLPVLDDKSGNDAAGRPDPKYFRLWDHIKAELKPSDKLGKRRPKPEKVYEHAQGALTTLASQWKKRFDEIAKADSGGEAIPPVMIVVCDNTDVAEVFFRKISGEKREEVEAADGTAKTEQTVYGESEVLPDFTNAPGVQRTVRIDTKLLAKVETEEGETKDQAAAALREIINTVGKRGGVGEQIRSVVSVSMLTEGWDATNVTHILGVRAFDSQLLCEQVVGRGLRRMDYTVDPQTGMLTPEYVDVYGIPFSLIPYKGKTEGPEKPDPVYHHVYAVPEREGFEIRMPLVESYTYELRESGIRCDVAKLEGFIVDQEPTRVFLNIVRGYQDQATAAKGGEYIEQNRDEFYASVRFQQVIFRIAQLIMDDLIQGSATGGKGRLHARHQVFPEIVRIVQEFVKKKVKFADDVDQRELALDKYAGLLQKRVRDGIMPAAASDDAPLLPIVNSFKPWITTAEVNYRTTRPVAPLVKSHLNFAPLDAETERSAIEQLEDQETVECYTPNDRNVGLAIPYEYQDTMHLYEPDFVVRMHGGMQVMVEIKGRGGELHDEDRVLAKNAAAKKWVAAVNNAGRYGRWAFATYRPEDGKSIVETLAPYAEGALYPFKFVTPQEGEKYRSCLPIASVRSIARKTRDAQGSLDEKGTWFSSWVAFESRIPFEPGMFVSRVHSGALGAESPAGAYCLFRGKVDGEREGRTLLVRHGAIRDLTLGSMVSFGKYSSERVESEKGEVRYRIRIESLNPSGSGADIAVDKEEEVEVLAELLEVLPEPST